MRADLPAVLGGAPVFPAGPPPWPRQDSAVLDALQHVWQQGSWGRYVGGSLEQLEEHLTRYHGVSVATCGSGSFAVELALRALRLGPGDEVIVSAYDYPGNFLSVHAVGALPVLVDIHPGNATLALDRLEAACGPATRALLVSHLHGGLAPMAQLMAFARSHNLRVIEDAAQASGAIVEGKPAGTWGDAGVLSFGGSKLLTAGRGGALLTPHAEVRQRANLLLTRAGNLVHPLSELQAAVLLPQVQRLQLDTTHRWQRVQQLSTELAPLPGLRCFENDLPDSLPAYYKVGLWLDDQAFGLPRTTFLSALRAEGVAIDEGFRAVHVGRSPSRFRRAGALTQAERAQEQLVMLHHPVLLESAAVVSEVARAFHKVWHQREALR